MDDESQAVLALVASDPNDQSDGLHLVGSDFNPSCWDFNPPPPAPTFSSLLDDLLILPEASHDDAMSCSGGAGRSHADLLADALHQIFSQRTDFLAQLWVPVVRNSQLMLSTQDQPYAVQPAQADLVRYRALSARYVFPAQRAAADQSLHPGLPGRVFTTLSPEWSPNVQLYDCADFLRVRDAARCNVRGTLAVPVIEPDSRDCMAVIELVTNAEKFGYEDELGLICRALHAVNLSSWSEGDGGGVEVLQDLIDKFVTVDGHASPCFSKVPLSDDGRVAVFSELHEVLRAVCEIHKLPMAQTWIPIQQQESGFISLFTRNSPCYVKDPAFQGFRQACSEQRLEVGQGVAGKAFTTNQPSYKGNVQSFSREEYPLLQYARYFKIRAAAAIRLRSPLTGPDDYIVEFILPPDCTEPEKLLNGISSTMERVCRSLRTMKSQELLVMEQWSPSSSRIVEETSSVVDSRATITGGAKRKKLNHGESGTSRWSASSSHDGTGKKTCERKRATNEKTVALEVLQQHFAGSLRDAAKSIGVCPTTLKRICRQYGISRWPSRKINKVNRSLMKLQGVIESVEGVDRTVKLDSLTGDLATTAAATAALTSAKLNRNKSISDLQGGAAAVEGLNVFQEPQQTGVPDDHGKTTMTTSEQEQPGMSSWKNFNIKIEPRVHGSSAALSFLERQNSIPLEAAAAAAAMVTEEKIPPCIDWAALKLKTSNEVPLNSYKNQLLTIKATLGSDTVRFKLTAGFGFEFLKEEVGSRFNLEVDSFSLKYMDDDSEWVVLNGDGDLEECIDVMESSSVRIIKLVVHVKGNSVGSPSFCSVNS